MTGGLPSRLLNGHAILRVLVCYLRRVHKNRPKIERENIRVIHFMSVAQLEALKVCQCYRNAKFSMHSVLFDRCHIVFQDDNKVQRQTRSSWLNCALRDGEAVYWVSIGHYEAVAVGN